ncbi:lantibiotic immunity ABC transporter MutG family permease subunit [Scatolibacter rhodanostii]|uniref:lantibiotic immunity ABC transporter MutG family permease subunit n=1 Tax=Scatolibacter rhodanostii TaxID=2014781 RepID=UPI000C0864EC|nr:lantibiotic immunity ABC transporter MutG family permease subunit [Scatolibacter rhodanostii]
MLGRCMCSDFYKIKRTPVLWLHVAIPLLGTFAFLGYYHIVPDNHQFSRISGFLEVLCIVFPALIGLFCGLMAAQEEQAGGYQFMLTGTKSRATAYLSKLFLLLLLSAFSIALAIGVFAIGYTTISIPFYLRATFAIWGGTVFLYVLHLFVSFRFGRGASIGLGIFGCLISALMLTGLGDSIWQWVPWSWNARFCDNMILAMQTPSAAALATANIQTGAIICTAASILSIAASLLWFRCWNGAKSNE